METAGSNIIRERKRSALEYLLAKTINEHIEESLGHGGNFDDRMEELADAYASFVDAVLLSQMEVVKGHAKNEADVKRKLGLLYSAMEEVVQQLDISQDKKDGIISEYRELRRDHIDQMKERYGLVPLANSTLNPIFDEIVARGLTTLLKYMGVDEGKVRDAIPNDDGYVKPLPFT